MGHRYIFFFKQKTAYEIASCLVGSEMCIRDRVTTGVSNPLQSRWMPWYVTESSPVGVPTERHSHP